ncbi:MAG: anaerobic ribonucleoside-triphosphate reductase activating protein [Christensenellaceae bacterium]|jgi:anaerobic ribonucleoside-triphosphate reductase activating protein|nr:anaerobic ribonucleoside-triphosphate reductase activating protein [Christensenellaceae bacterium]
MNNIRVAGFEKESITDGPGIRYTLFVQGCPHHCKGCHNQKALSFSDGIDRSVESVFNEIAENPLLSGVTFSGGEPFCQPKPLTELARLIKNIGLEIAVYTGYEYDELFNLNNGAIELLKEIDVLVDGKYIESERSLELRFKGSKNQRVIDVCSSLEKKAVVLDSSDRWE